MPFGFSLSPPSCNSIRKKNALACSAGSSLFGQLEEHELGDSQLLTKKTFSPNPVEKRSALAKARLQLSREWDGGSARLPLPEGTALIKDLDSVASRAGNGTPPDLRGDRIHGPDRRERDQDEGMMVTKRGMRLSVQPVDKGHFRIVRSMGKKG